MAYECNDSSCRPCKHVELDVTCPKCLKHRLIVAPHGNWVFCPDWHGCEWEMSHEKYLNHDVEGERRATIERKADFLREDINAKRAELARLESDLERFTIP